MAETERSGGAPQTAGKTKKKFSWKTFFLVLFLLILAAVLTAGGLLWHYVNTVLDSVAPASDATALVEENKTDHSYKGDVVNLLVCGIDYEEGRTYGANDENSNDGMTDMIMYVQLDVKNSKCNMLQIPRNTLVGKTVTCENTTGNTYKASNGQINSIALSNKDGISALADVITNAFALPIDYYVTIDMEALGGIVDRFGGIEVYIPQDIDNGKGSYLPAGYHKLLGDAVEFFVRNRKGAGYEDADISRLNMQRYFYAGLFKAVRKCTIADVLKLMPVFEWYVTTDCEITTMAQLGVSFLNISSADIMVCQAPVYLHASYYEGNSVVVADPVSIAALLDTYFSTYTEGTTLDELHLMDWEHEEDSLTDANVQFMGQLDAQADSAILSGNTDLYQATTTDGQVVNTD